MICPKCGFNQPDDIYCVLCGVDIERYAGKKKKRRYKRFILLGLAGIAVLSVAKYATYVHHDETVRTAGKDRYVKTKTQEKGRPASGVRQNRRRSANQLYSKKKADQVFPSRSQRKTPKRDMSEVQRSRKAGSGAGSLASEQEAGLTHKKETAKLTALQWFEKGSALDDDSEAEIQSYEKAMDLDPKFAPAYYRLGGIYYRQANYEPADQQFAKFLKHASETDRETYDIYVYYSMGDVERLSEEEPKDKDDTEEAEKDTSSEAAEETAEEASEEADEEADEAEDSGEEVMTVVKYSAVNGHVVVPVVLNGFFQAKVLVDTGAGITIVSRELARNLRLEADPNNFVTLKTMAMDIEAQLASLDSIQVGDLSKKDFPVAITDFSMVEEGKFDGILGMDFMRHYQIQINSQNNTIVFSPNAG